MINSRCHKIFLICVPVFSFMLLQYTFLSGSISAQISPELDLEDAGQVRVSLFGMNPPKTLQLTADSASVSIYKNGSEEEINLENYSADLTIKNGVLKVKISDEHLSVDSLTVRANLSPVRIITDAFGYRYYSGRLDIKPNSGRNALSVINTVDLEIYVASVVGSEMDFEEPEALKTQAVVSRSYALWSIRKSPYSNFDLRDFEANQMYVGQIRDKPRYREAAEATAGEILTWSNQLILAVFSSTCGGMTANNTDVWGGENHPYLRSQNDTRICSVSPHFSWEYELKKVTLDSLLKERYGFRFRDKEIETDQTGRIQQIELIDRSGDILRFSGNEFRLYINRHAGPLAVRSTKFKWTEHGDTISFEGNGLGHGVGLCQWGARGLAQNGWNYKDILTFYFSGVKIVNYNDIETSKITLYN